MSAKTALLYIGALTAIGFVSGAYAALNHNPEPVPALASEQANVSFITPTISVAGGRDIATCPESYELRYEELGGARGGVICMKMTPPE